MSDVPVTALATQSAKPSALQRLTTSKPAMRLLMKLLVALLLLVAASLTWRAVTRLPPAAIELDGQGLNAAQYQQLHRLVGDYAPTNVIQADLTHYVNELEQVPWVEQVDARRNWQRGILLHVTPRHAVAKFGSQRLMDANGVVYIPADSRELTAHHWMQLQGDSQYAPLMMQQVKQVSDWFVPLGLRVDEVIVSPRLAWLFRFENGLRVLVDNDNTAEKLYQLSIMLQNQLRPKLADIQTIDLRYKNGMAITWRPAAVTTSSAATSLTADVSTKSSQIKPSNKPNANAQASSKNSSHSPQ